jgi:hypothetical protein
MRTLCTVLFVCITLSHQAMAEGDSTLSRAEEGIQSIPESGAFPVAAFQKSWGTSDLLLPQMASFDTTPGGGATPHTTPRLMPDNLSFMERGLWGENGFFRSVGIAGELTPESRKSELSARRTMLTMHQIGGFVTLGLMGVTLYYGQKALNDSNIPGQERTDQSKHNQFVTYTIISYGLTGLLAAISPPPLIRRNETSTTTIHKTLAWIHFAGMILTPIVGNMIKKRSGHFSYIDLPTAHFHQVSAYITTGVFAASMIIITF